MYIAFHKAVCWTLIASLLQGVSAPAALAACNGSPSGGSGPPSISATEISTSQALELLRKRREESVQTASLGPVQIPVSVVTSAPPPAAAPPAQPVAAVPPPAPAAVVAAPAPTAPVPTTVLPPVVATAPTAPPAVVPPAVALPAVPPAPASPQGAPAAPAVKLALPAVSPSRPTAPGVATPKAVQPPSQPASKPLQMAAKEPAVPTVVARSPARPSKDPATMVKPTPAPTIAASVVYKTVAMEPVRPVPTRGIWAEVFGDAERESGLTYDGSTIGGLRSSRLTGGLVSGMDWRITPTEASRQIILGVLSSSFHGKTRFNDLTYFTPDPSLIAGDFDLIGRQNASETAAGFGAGVYALASTERWSFDAMARVDHVDVQQRDTTQFLGAFTSGTFIPCGTDDLVNRSAIVDYIALVTAANFNLRHKLNTTTTLEPTIGFRATFIDYGAPNGSLPLAVEDGSILRLQAGARLIDSRLLANGNRGTLTLTGLLYSDVLIDGLTPVNSFGFNPSAVNEGKIRALGSLGYSLAHQDGWTFTAQGEVRGGENLFGGAAKFSMRYEW